jgi:hypothetical protein
LSLASAHWENTSAHPLSSGKTVKTLAKSLVCVAWQELNTTQLYAMYTDRVKLSIGSNAEENKQMNLYGDLLKRNLSF